jgi:AAA family ATP:ADP antiporter
MLTAGLVLEVAVLCHRRSLRACVAMVGGDERTRARVASAGVLEGLRLLWRSPYLLGIAVFVLISSVAATSFYYVLNDLAGSQIATEQERRALFSTINLCQNLCALVIQVWITRSALLRLGLAVVLCIMPAVTLLGLSLVAVVPTIVMMAVFEVARRTLQFAFDKPAREVLFTPLGLEEKYKSKAFLDTAVLRLGDLVGAGVNDLLVRLQVGGTAVAAGAVPFVILWCGVGWWLGRSCRAQEAGYLGSSPSKRAP